MHIGDADGDGSDCTSPELTLFGGVDLPFMALSESFALFFDLGGALLANASSTGLDGVFDFVVGYPGGDSVNSDRNHAAPCDATYFTKSCFGIYEYDTGASFDPYSFRFLNNECPIASRAVAYDSEALSNTNTLRWLIENFSALRQAARRRPGDPTSRFMSVLAYAGSMQDDGIGEVLLPVSGVPVQFELDPIDVASFVPSAAVEQIVALQPELCVGWPFELERVGDDFSPLDFDTQFAADNETHKLRQLEDLFRFKAGILNANAPDSLYRESLELKELPRNSIDRCWYVVRRERRRNAQCAKVFIAAQCAWAYENDGWPTRPSFRNCERSFRSACTRSVIECGTALDQFLQVSWQSEDGLKCVSSSQLTIFDKTLLKRR